MAPVMVETKGYDLELRRVKERATQKERLMAPMTVKTKECHLERRKVMMKEVRLD